MSSCRSCESECTSRSSMYTRTLSMPLTTDSMSRWKLAGQPSRPIGEVTHWYWPMPGTVKAVYGRHLGSSNICQNPAVRSSVEKMWLPDRPICPIQPSMSCMEYLSTNVCLLSARKSCTSRTPPVFFMTAKMGLLYLLRAASTTPSLIHSLT